MKLLKITTLCLSSSAGGIGFQALFGRMPFQGHYGVVLFFFLTKTEWRLEDGMEYRGMECQMANQKERFSQGEKDSV